MPIGNPKDSKNSKSRSAGRFAYWTISLTESASISATQWKKPSKRPRISVKTSSGPSSENKMRHPAKVSLFVCVAVCLTASLFATPKKEYFTEDELDLIRDAQDLNARVPTYFKLAERRLIFL